MFDAVRTALNELAIRCSLAPENVASNIFDNIFLLSP
jgi:hypothetical protein